MKKNTALKIMYLVIAILSLQVIKTIIARTNWDYGFYSATIISALQFLLLIIFPLVALCRLLLGKLFPSRKGVFSWLLAFLLLAFAEWQFTGWLKNPAVIPGFLKESYRYFYYHHSYNLAQFDPALSTYDAQLFYKLKPGLTGSFKNAEFSHLVTANSKGMRDDDSSLYRPAIICLGDSYTWGWGVDQAHTWPQLLENQKGMKLLNASMPSFGTARSMMRLAQLDTSNLQYLLLQYCINDEGENQAYIKGGYHLPISSETEYNKLTRSHRINSLYFPGKNFLLIASIFLKKFINKVVPVFHFEALYGEKEMVNEKAVTEFLDILSKAPVDFTKVKIIAFHLDAFPLVTDRFYRLTDSLSHTAHYDSIFNNHLQVVDMSRVLRKQDYYEFDPHLLPSAQEKIAQALGGQMGH
jgi:hypothetical protein